MERIRQKDLENLVDRINEATNSPMATYTKNKDGSYTANIENYLLDYAYNGVALEKITNKNGGVSRISTGGYGTKRELYNWMQAFLAGISQK